jgi:hypothetical protein
MSLMKRNGVLITCDIPTMQVIKFMDKQEGGKMIIKELDERNVFIHRTFSTSHLLCLLLHAVLCAVCGWRGRERERERDLISASLPNARVLARSHQH